MRRLTLLGGIGLFLATATGLGWILAREEMGRSITKHWVAQALDSQAQGLEWTVLVDHTRRPGRLEPIMLAELGGPPWRRIVIWDTHGPPSVTGPLLEQVLLGASGGPPQGPVRNVVWRTSTATLLSSHREIPDEVSRIRPQRTFVGQVQERTFFHRAEHLRVTVAGTHVILVAEGGRQPRSIPGDPHPLRSTEPFRWDP